MNLHSRSVAASFDYRLFGLHIRSEIELPELPPAGGSAAADVQVRMGKAPQVPSPGAAGLHAVEGGLLLPIHDVGRFFVKDGAEIIVEPNADVPERNVRLYLLGSAMGALLHQRGMLPLHANCVEIGGKAFAFMGKSGAGKSTLAAWFHDHGHRVIADDVCVIRFDEAATPLVSPGLPRLRLWKEALEATGRQPSSYTHSYAGDETYEKFDVSIDGGAIDPAEIELGAIYLLEAGPRLKITALTGVEAAEAVFANTYRGAYVAAAGNSRLHWESCLELIRRSPLFRLTRAWGLPRLTDDGERIVAHAKTLAIRLARD